MRNRFYETFSSRMYSKYKGTAHEQFFNDRDDEFHDSVNDGYFEQTIEEIKPDVTALLSEDDLKDFFHKITKNISIIFIEEIDYKIVLGHFIECSDIHTKQAIRIKLDRLLSKYAPMTWSLCIFDVTMDIKDQEFKVLELNPNTNIYE